MNERRREQREQDVRVRHQHPPRGQKLRRRDVQRRRHRGGGDSKLASGEAVEQEQRQRAGEEADDVLRLDARCDRQHRRVQIERKARLRDVVEAGERIVRCGQAVDDADVGPFVPRRRDRRDAVDVQRRRRPRRSGRRRCCRRGRDITTARCRALPRRWPPTEARRRSSAGRAPGGPSATRRG